MSTTPILWSFRRCPYAIRARLAIRAAGVTVRLREIVLRGKPDAFLAASPSATVPCLEADRIIDESRDIMMWALEHRDPCGWLSRRDEDLPLIDACDGPFKAALDHTKYHVRYPTLDRNTERAKAAMFLHELNNRLGEFDHLTGPDASLADAAILPFVRQFAFIDRDWFDAQDWPFLIRWLDRFLNSDDFKEVMVKYDPWQIGQDGVPFP